MAFPHQAGSRFPGVSSDRKGSQMDTFLPDVVKWWESNWGTIIASVVIGYLLNYIFHLKGKKEKTPCYAVRNKTLIENLVSKFPAIQVMYEGNVEPIENLSVAKILFCNQGSDVIYNQDMVEDQPFAIAVKEGCKIIEIAVVFAKEPANQIVVTRAQDRSKATLSFDHMGRDEGVIIQVIHTGLNSADLFMIGKVKGVGKPFRMKYLRIEMFDKVRGRLAKDRMPTMYRRILFGSFCLFAAIVLSVFVLISPPPPEPDVGPVKFLLFAPVRFLLLVFSIPYWYGAYRLFRRGFPKGFEAFEDDS